jgi:TPR repeat protein
MVVPFNADDSVLEATRMFHDQGNFMHTIEFAKSGDVDSQYQMGVWLLEGSNLMVKTDIETAAECLAKAAGQGHEKAQNVLEQISLAKEKEKPEHLRCYICLAGAQKYYPCFNECDKTEERRREEAEQKQKEKEQLFKEAEQGDPAAQFNAGYAYEFGLIVPKDYAKAAEWYLKSAEQGNADAQSRLGFYYYRGRGVNKDHAKAFVWYLKAAEQGDVEAKYNLDKLNGKEFSWHDRDE